MILFRLEVEHRVFVFVPDIARLEHVNGAFRVTTIYLEAVTLLLVEALNPDASLESRLAFDGAELRDLLELHKPRVEKQITCLVYTPDPHRIISARRYQELHFL